MSKARQKGTAGENFFLPGLRRAFGAQVERAPLKGTQDDGDYVGVPFQHEAKNTKKPLFLQWARTASKKSFPWVILWKGDLRRLDGPYATIPYSLYIALAEHVHEVDWPSVLARAEDFELGGWQ